MWGELSWPRGARMEFLSFALASACPGPKESVEEQGANQGSSGKNGHVARVATVLIYLRLDYGRGDHDH